MKQNWLDFLSLPAESAFPHHAAHRASALETLLLHLCVIRVETATSAPLVRTGIELSNLAALLDFPNVIRPNESNPDSETSHLQTSLSP